MRPGPSEEGEVKVELQEGDVDGVPQEDMFRIVSKCLRKCSGFVWQLLVNIFSETTKVDKRKQSCSRFEADVAKYRRPNECNTNEA